MSTTDISNFIWGDIALSQVAYVDGIPHATRAAIGEWLEYADPQKAIDNILARNSYIEAHSVPLNLRGTDGKNYDTFAYHPIGFLLIVMESGQPKAQAMKQAVAEFVWHFAGPRKVNFKERESLLKLRRNLINDLARTKDAFCQQALLADLREVSLACGLPVPDVAFLGKNADQLALPGV